MKRASFAARLVALLVAGSPLALSAAARADELVVRGNYYRDRNTRVIQPEAVLSKEAPHGWIVGGHYLLDTITSASLAAGVLRDQPFTELRNEAGFSLAKRLGPAIVGGSYSYSQESDYRAQFATLSAAVELFQKNTLIGGSVSYGHDNVYQRMGPATFIPVGALDHVHVIAQWSQVLAPTVLFNLSYDLGVVGFGSADNGFQANPYRPASVGGMPAREAVPFQRIRNALALSVHWIIPLHNQLVPYLAFRPSYRFYWDDWGLQSHTPELRTYLPIGPVELRFTGRYYSQGHVSFWNEVDGKPAYPSNQGLQCTTCLLGSSQRNLFVTGDPKLGAYDDYYFDVRVLIKFGFIRRLWPWASEGWVELNYGHLFQTRYAQTAFGDADLAGLQFTFPL
ncbi:MAG TPA: DUF3570 domain-containing protein [Polyangia bacterium]|nr:DUF3570 domain-containing protein [Polyangia bacterium]